MRKLCVLITAILFFFGLTLAYAFKTVQIDQDRVRVINKAGATYNSKFEVKNPSDEPKAIKIYLQDWVYADEEANKRFLPIGTVANSCANWIKIVPQEALIPAYGKAVINYSIAIPENTSGGYFAIAFIESLLGKPEVVSSQTDTAAAVVPVAVRIGLLFAVEIQDTTQRKIEIRDLSLKREGKNYLMQVAFENTGNTDIKANGDFSIMGSNGMVYARGTFKDDAYTLPKDKAKLEAIWRKALPRGSYDVVLTIDLGKSLEEMGLGRGPVMVREAKINVADNGDIIAIGEVK